MTHLTAQLTAEDLRRLLDVSAEVHEITDEQRQNLSHRFRSVPTLERRRLDAWSVEHSGSRDGTFAWGPSTARRVIATAALRYGSNHDIHRAVQIAIDDQIDRARRGYARPGSLAHWMVNVPEPVIAIVAAEAVTWAVTTLESLDLCGTGYRIAPSDNYYDVAGALTSLRGRRDAIIDQPDGRVVLRCRAGLPSRTAIAGLRSDLVVDALAHPQGQAAQRFIGIWPEAGIVLAVDGDATSLRLGARDLVRAAIVQRRRRLQVA